AAGLRHFPVGDGGGGLAALHAAGLRRLGAVAPHVEDVLRAGVAGELDVRVIVVGARAGEGDAEPRRDAGGGQAPRDHLAGGQGDAAHVGGAAAHLGASLVLALAAVGVHLVEVEVAGRAAGEGALPLGVAAGAHGVGRIGAVAVGATDVAV